MGISATNMKELPSNFVGPDIIQDRYVLDANAHPNALRASDPQTYDSLVAKLGGKKASIVEIARRMGYEVLAVSLHERQRLEKVQGFGDFIITSAELPSSAEFLPKPMSFEIVANIFSDLQIAPRTIQGFLIQGQRVDERSKRHFPWSDPLYFLRK